VSKLYGPAKEKLNAPKSTWRPPQPTPQLGRKTLYATLGGPGVIVQSRSARENKQPCFLPRLSVNRARKGELKEKSNVLPSFFSRLEFPEMLSTSGNSSRTGETSCR